MYENEGDDGNIIESFKYIWVTLLQKNCTKQ